MTNRTAARIQTWGWATLACLASLLTGIDATAAEPEWKAGLAQVLKLARLVHGGERVQDDELLKPGLLYQVERADVRLCMSQ